MRGPADLDVLPAPRLASSRECWGTLTHPNSERSLVELAVSSGKSISTDRIRCGNDDSSGDRSRRFSADWWRAPARIRPVQTDPHRAQQTAVARLHQTFKWRELAAILRRQRVHPMIAESFRDSITTSRCLGKSTRATKSARL